MSPDLERARLRFQTSRRAVVFSGAGLSAESGVPTFRGKDGLWKQFSAEDLANPEAFAADPELVWEWYQWRRDLIARCSPNAAHEAIAAYVKRRGRGAVSLITQNVDGLLQAAGADEVLELHGSLWTVRCTGCRRKRQLREPAFPALPRCPECGVLERPHVVWFGEPLDQGVWQGAMAACAGADAVLVVGTSGIVFPAAGLVELARRSQAYICGVNLDEPPQRHLMDDFFQGKAGEWVSRILG